MPVYEFRCDTCGYDVEEVFAFGKAPGLGDPLRDCGCGGSVVRVVSLPDVQLTEGDPDDVPPEHAVTTHRDIDGVSKRRAARMERAYARDIAEKRKQARESRGGRRKAQMTHSIPAHLYHGKIRQTGDKNYWDDPKNRSKHSSTKI